MEAETRQQDAGDGALLTASNEVGALIIGQCCMPFVADAICSQHESIAMACVASKTIASIEATSLKRHVMFFKEYYGVRT